MASTLPDFRRGDTYPVELYIVNEDDAAYDITGWVFTFTLKSVSTGLIALQISKTAGDDTKDDPSNGMVYLEIDSDTSAAQTPGSYYYDVQRSIPGSPPDVRTILPDIENPHDKLRIFEDVSV